MKIYLAGALFNVAEREYAQKIVEHLENKGLNVYWPWRDAGDKELKALYRNRMEKVNDEIVKNNLFAIKKADLIIAILKGSEVESGTSMEIGYSYALGKKILGLRTDFRTQGKDIGPLNIMISRSLDKLFSSEESLISGAKFWI